MALQFIPPLRQRHLAMPTMSQFAFLADEKIEKTVEVVTPVCHLRQKMGGWGPNQSELLEAEK
jgi:hypothetical protein